MALIKSMVFTVMVYIVANVEALKPGNPLLKKPIAKSEDLINQSKTSIVSLDKLFTSLSVQVSRLTLSLSELSTDLDRTKADITAMQSSFKKDIEKVETDIAGIMTGVRTTKTEIDKLKTSNVEISRKVDKVNKQVAVVSVDQTKLKTSIVEINRKVDKVNRKVAVVSVEQTGGNGNCVKVCAGTTGRGKSNWNYYARNGIYMDVNIGSCGFVRTPTITTSIEGGSNHWTATGTSSIYSATNTKFRIYLGSSKLRVEEAKSWKWNVEWIAIGHTC